MFARDYYTLSMEFHRCRLFGYLHNCHTRVYVFHLVGFLGSLRPSLPGLYMISSDAEAHPWMTVSNSLGVICQIKVFSQLYHIPSTKHSLAELTYVASFGFV